MKKIEFFVYDELQSLIDEMVIKYGFRSRAEFTRYCTIEFIRREGERIPSDEALKEHTKTLQSLRTHRTKKFY